MSAQPNALRLADALEDADVEHVPSGPYRYEQAYYRPECDLDEAAAELRRLHAVNAQLLEELEDAADAFAICENGGGVNFHEYARQLRAVIAKATGEKP